MDFTKVTAALREREFAVSTFATAKEAADYLNEQIDGVSVGFGGSVTLREMGLVESLSVHNEGYNHWTPPEGMSIAEAAMRASTADVFLTSVNGLAETGEIINIDGTGNRVASMLYGHKKVYFVVGRNKIASDYDAALFRARNIAAPKNARRLARRTPCAAKADRCYNCKSPERICRGLVVLWEAMKSCEMEFVLIDEELGF